MSASSAYFLNPKFQYSHRLGEHGDLKKHINTVYEKLYPKDKGSDAFGNELIRFMEGKGMFGCDAAIQSRKVMKPRNTAPPKPYERASTSSGPAPFRPASAGNTSDVVEASGTAKPGEVVSTTQRSSPVNTNALGRPVPTRPWEQNYGNSYGGYGSGLNYNSGYGSGNGAGMYSSYGGFGGSYGGGLYGNNLYRGPYGNGLYGGGMYNSGFGSPYGGYGMGMGMGGPYGDQDPNNPFGGPPSPPGFWISFLRVMQGVVSFFGRISILIDQNTQAFHMFMTALLQLFDRSGMLYGELARFVLRLLGIKTKPRKPIQQGPGALPGPDTNGQRYIEGPKAASGSSSGSWENVWADDGK